MDKWLGGNDQATVDRVVAAAKARKKAAKKAYINEQPKRGLLGWWEDLTPT